jgi:hypothetical protein
MILTGSPVIREIRKTIMDMPMMIMIECTSLFVRYDRIKNLRRFCPVAGKTPSRFKQDFILQFWGLIPGFCTSLRLSYARHLRATP